MGPGKMSQYDENGGKFSGEFFFLEFMAGGEGIKKRRFAENLLFSEGLYIHFDVIKSATTKLKAEKIVKDATTPVKMDDKPAKSESVRDEKNDSTKTTSNEKDN